MDPWEERWGVLWRGGVYPREGRSISWGGEVGYPGEGRWDVLEGSWGVLEGWWGVLAKGGREGGENKGQVMPLCEGVS